MIKTLIVISLLALAVCKPSHECSETGIYSCPESTTCCKTTDESANGGFRCFPIQNGVCCEGTNTIGVCPASTTCDIPNKKCSYSTTRLLQEEEYDTPLYGSFEPTLLATSLTAVDTNAMIDGFLEGIAIFKGVTLCKPADKMKPLIDEILKLKNAISNITDISKIKATIDKFEDVFHELKNAFEAIANDCGKSKDSIVKIIDDLDDKIGSWSYIPSLIKHSVSECFTIVDKSKELVNNWSSSSYFNNGKKIGELFKFVLFWQV